MKSRRPNADDKDVSSSLQTLDRIKASLARVASTDELCDLRNKANAIAVYSRQQKDAKDIEVEAIRIRLRCERKLGELLATTVKAGNPQLSAGMTIRLPSSITRNQSSAFQQLAKLPEREFDSYLESCRKPSTKGLVRLSIQQARKKQSGPTKGHNVLTGDMSLLHTELADDSVNLFLTDPPFGDIQAYENLAELAATKLRNGGLCVAYSGVNKLPAVMSAMSKHLAYHWCFAVAYQGPHRAIFPKNIQGSWRPIVAFAKGKPQHDWIIDMLHGSGREKDLHPWQQPQREAEYLISRLSYEGDLVVDPFAGSGTTLAAAKKLNRRYLGCEINAATARGARRRVAA